ncbi:hypothetical protein ACOJDJ_000784 [Cronobacter dublinensis]
MVKNVVLAQHARFGKFGAEPCQIADELRQNTHIEITRGLPPLQIKLAKQAHTHQAFCGIPALRQSRQIARQMRG